MIDVGKLSVILSALSPRMLEGAALAMPSTYAAAPPVVRHGAVAVVPVIGTLMIRTGGLAALSRLTSFVTLAATLQETAADPGMRGIIPGDRLTRW